jgi:hypothetical protein
MLYSCLHNGASGVDVANLNCLVPVLDQVSWTFQLDEGCSLICACMNACMVATNNGASLHYHRAQEAAAGSPAWRLPVDASAPVVLINNGCKLVARLCGPVAEVSFRFLTSVPDEKRPSARGTISEGFSAVENFSSTGF